MAAQRDIGYSRVVRLDNQITVIAAMWTPPNLRRRGLGSGRLDELCRRADADKETLVISPYPTDEDGMSRGQLEEWLIRMGFVPNRGVYADASIVHSMYRRPRE